VKPKAIPIRRRRKEIQLQPEIHVQQSQKLWGCSSGEHYSNHTLRGHDDQATQTMLKPQVQNNVSMPFQQMQHCKCGSNKENCNSRLAAPDFDGTVVQLQHESSASLHLGTAAQVMKP
jgi:hypothetical protein